jgi:signal transduction histidine kinase
MPSQPAYKHQTASAPLLGSAWSLMSDNPNSLKLLCGFSVLVLLGAYLFFNYFKEQQWALYEQQGSLMAQLIAGDLQSSTANPNNGLIDINSRGFSKQFQATCSAIYRNQPSDLLRIQVLSPQQELKHECQQPGVVLPKANQIIENSSPLRSSNPSQATAASSNVVLHFSGASVHSNLNLMKQLFLLMFLGGWIITLLAVIFNTYIWSKHLRDLSQGVQRLSSGEFGFKIEEHKLWGELKTLAQAFNDMSDRLQAYEAQNIETLTLERNKLEAIVLSIADGVVVCEDSGVMLMVNEAAARMLGVKSCDLLEGRNVKDYTTLNGEKVFQTVLEAFRDFRLAQNQQKQDQLNQTPYRRGQGEASTQTGINRAYASDEYVPLGSNPKEHFHRTVELPDVTLKVFLSPIRDPADSRLGFVMIIHDVTREMEVDKLKTNFISNVSHELRTPVTTIKSYVDTLYSHGDELDEETYKEFIETIHLETERLKKLVNDILDFSRLEEGGVHMEKQWQDLGPVVNLTVQSVRVLAQQKQLTLSTSIESNLPKVYMNSESIERVLRNLLSNAIKYTSEGGRIKVRAELSENGDKVEVAVQDNGIGIADEHLPYIFDRFYRVENKVHTVKGTGLGLHLVKVAIEDYHEGEVFVSSKPEQGSTFGFRLPIVVVNPEEDDEEQLI